MGRWSDNLISLKDKHQTIYKDLKDKKVAYIDIPLHYNVGDILIYLGTEKFLADHKVDVVYRAFNRDVDFKKLKEVDVVLLHGGGNFGDIYHIHQELRLNLVNKLKNKKIIFLPQSIHFNSKVNLNKTLDIMEAHDDLTVYVRDVESFNQIKDRIKKVELMPDMAHSLHPIISEEEVVNSSSKNNKILNLKRKDTEKLNESHCSLNKEAFDWDDILSREDVYFIKLIEKAQLIPIAAIRKKLVEQWFLNSKWVYFKSKNYFQLHDTVHTDRLHGFIFAYMLGCDVVVGDNSYGKCRRYIDLWLDDHNKIKFATKEISKI